MVADPAGAVAVRCGRSARPAAGLLALEAAWPELASAHGISGLASLPVPAWLFAWAAAIVLVVSFVAMSTLWSSPQLQQRRVSAFGRVPALLTPLCGLIGVALFALVIYAGYEGVPYYTANFDPTFIYVIFWVGVPVASVLTGDMFSAFSPWRAFARAVRWASRRLGVTRTAPLEYPAWLGRWPVVGGLLAFGWLELIYRDHDNPVTLASLALAYFTLMLVGMALFGIEAWTERGDAFGGYFNLFSRLALFEVRDGVLYRRRPLSALADLEIEPGTVAMVLAVIGITTFDGSERRGLEHARAALPERLQQPGAGADGGRRARGQHRTPARARRRQRLLRARRPRHAVDSRRYPFGQLLRGFAHTLVPIGFAYVLAHYFSLLVWQGQAIGYLASNPLGRNANLFGTAHWHINYNFINSTAIWYVQVAALVLGHVGGLALAHDRALSLYRSTLDAVRSQYWMLAVMVTFTCLGLWLLSAVNT